MTPVSRTVGEASIVNEVFISFTHTIAMDWLRIAHGGHLGNGALVQRPVGEKAKLRPGRRRGSFGGAARCDAHRQDYFRRVRAMQAAIG